MTNRSPQARSCYKLAALISIPASSLCVAETPNFSEDIAPLFYEHCSTCHNKKGIGPFSLISYDEISRRAQQIEEVVTDRYMPPWLSDSESSPRFHGERRLTEKQIKLVQDWVAAGSPAGDLANAPPPPEYGDGWTRGEPDLILSIPDTYNLAAEGEDVFRNFVIPMPLEKTQYVEALEFLPDPKLAIHHAVFTLDKTGDARERDTLDPGPGYGGMDLGSSTFPSGHIVGWAPGQVPYESYPGTAWQIAPGTDLVLQLHLIPTGKPELIQPKIGLHFTDKAPNLTSKVVHMAAYGIDIPPGDDNYLVKESIAIPQDAILVSLYPHAHYLAKSMKVEAIGTHGRRTTLLYIPNWDFNWQNDYRFVEAIEIKAGTRLEFEYTYDNSSSNIRNPNNPPKRVREGLRSSDEMGQLFAQFILREPVDVAVFDEAQARYEIGHAPDAPINWFELAIALENQGKLKEAIMAYEQVIEMDQTYAGAYNNLAIIFDKQGWSTKASHLYKEAIAHAPNLIEARYNLAMIYITSGREQEGAQQLQEILEIRPDDLLSLMTYGDLKVHAGQVAEAIEIFEYAIQSHPREISPYERLANAYLAIGYRDDAATTIKNAVNIAHSLGLKEDEERLIEWGESVLAE